MLVHKGQMLVHLCLFVLLSLMSHILCICLIIFEQINDDDDDDDDDDDNNNNHNNNLNQICNLPYPKLHRLINDHILLPV